MMAQSLIRVWMLDEMELLSKGGVDQKVLESTLVEFKRESEGDTKL